jgi:hypothetical protein
MTAKLKRLWLNNWDTAFIWGCVLILALLAGGALGATIDAIQAAATYR